MITTLLINSILLLFTTLFSLLPQVNTLPTVIGFDIDATMVTAISTYNTFAQVVWPLHYLLLGFLTIVGYEVTKIIVRAILGHRSPIN